MENLTREQESQLDALIAELEELPTAELIIEAARLRVMDRLRDTHQAATQDGDPAVEEAKNLFRKAMAGSIAAEKVMSYLLTLRGLEQMRITLGREIDDHRSRPMPTRTEDVRLYAMNDVLATQKAGLQEVTIHFFCNCVMHLHKLLQKAAEGAGLEIPAEDLAILNAYRDLRNYFEHIESRLPGQVNAREMVHESFTEHEWHFRAGLQIDDQGRVMVKGKLFDVTSGGLEHIEEVVRRTWDALKPAALEGIRQHFHADPSHIPRPEEVNSDLLTSVGGPPDREDHEKPRQV